MTGNVRVGVETLVQPQAVLHDVVVGERCVIEERVSISQCTIGSCCQVQSGATIHNSVVGNFCSIGIGSRLSGVKVGNACILGPNVVLSDGTVIDDNSSVFACTSNAQSWVVTPNINIKSHFEQFEQSRLALSAAASPQCLQKNFALKKKL